MGTYRVVRYPNSRNWAVGWAISGWACRYWRPPLWRRKLQ